MLAWDTAVDRKLALCVIIPLLLYSLIVVYATTGVASLEFKYAVWAGKAQYLPAMTELYRTVYRWGWVLPIGVGVWSGFLLRKPSCAMGGIALLAGMEGLLLTLWIVFTVVAFYLGNQSFVAGTQ